jgi:protein phosphatase
LLLCSDGLTDLVSNEEILASLLTRSLKDALDELVLLANRRGGHDNITIISLRVPVVEKPTIPVGQRRQRSHRLPLWLAGLGLCLVALLAAAGAIWAFSRLPPRETPPVTLTSLPPDATLPAALASPAASAPAISETVEAPEAAPAFTPPSPATLTPWPTNTLSPP